MTVSATPRALLPLHIRLKRHSDDSASITCTRDDGTVTWQRQAGKLGMVFPQHDLTHYAVETVLHYTDGFYGLVADGWNIEDFAVPYPRGQVPQSARQVELIVGCFDTERRTVGRMSVDEFNAHARTYVSSTRFSDVPVRILSAAELDAVRGARDALLARWNALPRGDALELTFQRSSV